ncbi:hypothetical protein [Candidatus Spongiihabitans sp.]|uniref:hypothetical protein n=1 Tax=Candidatus Spongiihabitans sp. TaxID=3101308 RepID=UPI003C7D6CAE
MTIIDWKVDNVSVVIVAQSHNPSIVNPDFLKNNGIVARDLEPTGPLLITPVVAQIEYGDIAWMVMPERCTIHERVNAKFQESYRVYQCAQKYIEVLKHIPYTALGLNWLIHITLNADSHEWVKSKFLKDSEAQKEIVGAEFTLKLQPDDLSICSLSTKIPDRSSVIVDCNFHFELKNPKSKINELKEILKRVSHYQDVLSGYLNKYFLEEENTT